MGSSQDLTMRALRIILIASTLLTWQISASPDAHFLRSLKSNIDAAATDSDHSIRTLRSSHFLRALRALGSKDLQRILRSDPTAVDSKSDAEDDEFGRNLRSNGDHFLRSLRSQQSGNSGHFLRSLKSAHDFMRMVRSDGHFLRSLRDVNGDQEDY